MEASCYRGDMSDRVFSRIARKLKEHWSIYYIKLILRDSEREREPRERERERFITVISYSSCNTYSYEAFYSLDNCRHCDLKKDTDKTARKTSFSMVRNQNESRNHEFTELVCKCRWTTIQGLCKINSMSATTLLILKQFKVKFINDSFI